MADPQAQGDAILQYLAQEGARRQAAVQQFRQTSVHHTLGPIGDFLHWAWYGKRPGAGLDAVPGQLGESFNPKTRGGLVNLASMLAGGGDFAGEDGLNLPPSSAHEVFAKHANDPQMQRTIQDFLRGRIAFKVHGEQGDGSLVTGSMGLNRLQDLIHKALGHNEGGVPHEFPFEHLPNFHEGPRGLGFPHEPDASLPNRYHEYVNNKLAQSGHHLDRWLAPREAALNAAHERAAAGAEHHFFSGQHPAFTELHEYGPHSQPSFNEHIRDAVHSDRKVAGLSRKNLMDPAQRGAREAALRRILQNQHRHLN